MCPLPSDPLRGPTDIPLGGSSFPLPSFNLGDPFRFVFMDFYVSRGVSFLKKGALLQIKSLEFPNY